MVEYEVKSKNLFIKILLYFFLLFSVLNTTEAQVADPELPRVYLNSSYPTLPANRNIRNVRSSCPTGEVLCYTNVQTALNVAIPGDEVVLEAGATFVGPFTLPNKNCSFSNQDQCYIIVRTSNLNELPMAGNRVSPANAGNMPKIVSPGNNEPALRTAPLAHHYRIVGIEFAKATPSAIVDTLILSGDGSGAQNSLSQLPSYIVFDRIYVHGDATSDLKRGIGLNSAHTSVIDSYISDIHYRGVEAQAIAGWNGSGPFKIVNNYLESSTQGFLYGGSDPSIPNLVMEDLEFKHNHVNKPLSWFDPTKAYTTKPHWYVKNIFELKNTRRALVEGNIFERTWVDGQDGYAILFTVRNQNGACPQCAVQDVTFRNNIVRHAAGGFQITGNDDTHPSQVTARIKIQNNIVEDINAGSWGGGHGWMFKILSGTNVAGPNDVQIIHNTLFQSGTLIWAGQFSGGTFVPKNNFVFKDNVGALNGYGVIGDNDGVGNATLGHYFPGAVFTKNVLRGGSSGQYSNYPGNFFTTNWASVLVNEPAGNYRVLSGSPYDNTATDSTDIGANIDLVEQATANVISGITMVSSAPPPPPPPPPFSCPGPLTNAFTGCYFNDYSLLVPVYTRTDNSINFDWGVGSPNSVINSDQFSVRWTGNFTFNSAVYDFTVTSDDGFRLFVDDVLILDHWVGQPPTTYVASRTMTAGSHQIKMEYFEDRIGATAQLSWSQKANPVALITDLNQDRVVNSLDWSIMNTEWLTSNTRSDLTVDGQVNSLDYAILSSHWGRTW